MEPGKSGTKFTLKSGNKTPFKMMGSSPLQSHDGTKSSATHFADGTPKSERDKFNDAETQREISKLRPKTGSGADSAEGQDQNKIFDNKGNHIGNWEGDKKVMHKTGVDKAREEIKINNLAREGNRKKKSPGKWAQFIPMALSALSSLSKKKED